MRNNFTGDFLLVSEKSFVIVIGGQVAINHFCVITNTNLKKKERIGIPLFSFTLKNWDKQFELTANRRALAILFSMRWSIAWDKSWSNAFSWACNKRTGVFSSNGCDHNDTVYITGGCWDDINGEIFQINAPWTRSNSSGWTWSALFKTMRVWYSRPFNWSRIASVSGPTSNFDGS